MATWDWSPYAVAGATRPDSFTGLTPAFRTSLETMFAAAPPEIQSQLRVMSGYRSPERQAQLWQGALKKYGSPEAARKWVAPPGRSNHNHGNAVDLRYLGPEATKWAHANASKYGLHFPLGNENWHIEPVGARSGHQPGPDGPKGQEVYAPPVDSTMVASTGMTGPDGQAASDYYNSMRDDDEKSPLKGLFDALAQYPDAQPARMGPMGDARQSGGGLLELLGAGGNPYAAFARKQRGILG